MTLVGLVFYMFAGVALASAVMVILARNPVHSVLFLILTFFNSAGLFVLMGAEFLAMILVVVYVGAVAVLFLFVVMMLDINVARVREGFLEYLPVGGVIGLVLLAELVMVIGGWSLEPGLVAVASTPTPATVSNTEAIGAVLYTDYAYLFQAAGLVLLVAMIGAIVLTHRVRENVRKQRVPDQLARRAEETVVLQKVNPGEGI
ncbi:MAG: NADH-quinone oxidoreductase subunit J [Pseudomonadota bacterium]|nr:NADH-quinone oxidoreductase subunit J [Pseudomonadota bacterium]